MKVVSRSCVRVLKSFSAYSSLAASSTREADNDSKRPVILSTTTASLSASIVEATYMNDAIGLLLPILDN